MPFDTPSLPTLITRASADIETSGTLRRSDADVIARVHAGGLYGVYRYLDWIFRQMFPDTADEDNLTRHGEGRGAPRKPATLASGMVHVTGAPGATVPAGAQLVAAGVLYQATVGASLDDGTATMAVAAVTAGAAGNQPAGAVLDFVSPVLGVQAAATVGLAGLIGGVDIEPFDVYRQRVIEHFRWVPHGGNADDYVTWAKAQPGVTRAWCMRNWVGPGTVAVFVVNDAASPITPTVLELAAIREAIEVRRPVTADVYVLAPELVPVQYQISVTPDTPAVRAAVEAALQALHLRESEMGAALMRTHVAEAISGAAGEFDHELVQPAANVVPSAGQLLTYGGVTWV